MKWLPPIWQLIALRGVKLLREQMEYSISGNLHNIFEKRNRELKRVNSYIRDKKQKNKFEVIYLNFYQEFYDQGLEASKKLLSSSYSEALEEAITSKTVCHVIHTYHNIIMMKSKNESITKPIYRPVGLIDSQYQQLIYPPSGTKP